MTWHETKTRGHRFTQQKITENSGWQRHLANMRA